MSNQCIKYYGASNIAPSRNGELPISLETLDETKGHDYYMLRTVILNLKLGSIQQITNFLTSTEMIRIR